MASDITQQAPGCSPDILYSVDTVIDDATLHRLNTGYTLTTHWLAPDTALDIQVNIAWVWVPGLLLLTTFLVKLFANRKKCLETYNLWDF